MGIKAGLVGLPNVGKSTLFNALTKSSIPAENYPFCTIEPHEAITYVPDSRIEHLYKLYKSEKKIPATMSFVDIAGLVKGASSGQGLGNQFLSHIREVDLILHVLRCFEDPAIIRESGPIDPVGDYEIITAELMLKDIDSIEKRMEKLAKSIKNAQSKPAELKEHLQEKELLVALRTALDKGDLAGARQLAGSQREVSLDLLSIKEYLIVANISEDDLYEHSYLTHPAYKKVVDTFGKEKVIPISVKTEYELSVLDEAQAKEAMEIVGITKKGLDIVIEKSYHHLGLITFFTCGPKEIHAWPLVKGKTVRQAAGEIHSDLERGFICAEVLNYQDLSTHGTPLLAKDAGKVKKEGQDYIVHDGDIILVRFNV